MTLAPGVMVTQASALLPVVLGVIASEATQQFFGARRGSAVRAIGAAGALVFAIAPLQRMAECVAEKPVPVSSTTMARVEVDRERDDPTHDAAGGRRSA